MKARRLGLENTRYGDLFVAKRMQKATHIYFVGIGGISMAGLAHMALAQGKCVSGCDREPSEATVALKEAGVTLYPDGTPLPPACDMVVYTLAIEEGHPAIREAKRRGIFLCGRADFLAGLMATYPQRVVVAGAHGKSTTVGMLSHLLTQGGLSPTVSGGAPLSLGGQAWQLGTKDLFLCEGCEYKGSFLSLSPTLGVVTNLELDHPDCYPTLSHMKEAFADFFRRCDTLILGGDSEHLMDIAPKGAVTYGFSQRCQMRGILIGRAMQVWEGENLLGTLTLKLTGAYNYLNALGALCAGRHLGLTFAQMRDALSNFSGIGRRMEYKGQVKGARVYLDYAHHPTEIREAVNAMKEQGGRVFVIYQPHTYTRTYLLWKDFVAALRLPHQTVLVDIYPAREAPLEGVTSYALAKEAGVPYASSFEEAVHQVLPALQRGDTLLLMGAGDVPKALTFLPLK